MSGGICTAGVTTTKAASGWPGTQGRHCGSSGVSSQNITSTPSGRRGGSGHSRRTPLRVYPRPEAVREPEPAPPRPQDAQPHPPTPPPPQSRANWAVAAIGLTAIAALLAVVLTLTGGSDNSHKSATVLPAVSGPPVKPRKGHTRAAAIYAAASPEEVAGRFAITPFVALPSAMASEVSVIEPEALQSRVRELRRFL